MPQVRPCQGQREQPQNISSGIRYLYPSRAYLILLTSAWFHTLMSEARQWLHSLVGSFPSALFSLQQAGTVSKESDPARSWAPGGQEFPEKAAVPAPIVLQVLVEPSVQPTPACVCKGCCEVHRLWLLLKPLCLPRPGQEACKWVAGRKLTCVSNRKRWSLLLNV